MASPWMGLSLQFGYQMLGQYLSLAFVLRDTSFQKLDAACDLDFVHFLRVFGF
jgi:hypothetical protein